MTILLVGEYSRLHNSLKEGLEQLGHSVTLVGSGDGFKGFSADYSFRAKWSETTLLNIPRQLIARVFGYDFAQLERGLRFRSLLKKFRNYNIVQLINERPVQTDSGLELSLLKKLREQNAKMFLLCCGPDYPTTEFLLSGKLRYSVLTPYLENPDLKKEYDYILHYRSRGSKAIHDFLYQTVGGVIASDIDYTFALSGNEKYVGLVPNPVNVSQLEFNQPEINGPIVIFLGINRWNYVQKGIVYFEKALQQIQQKYPEKISVIISENVPYNEYIHSYNQAHIVLDQVFGFDQGYNALEAMTKGKVVFTGAETEFMQHYRLSERVAVNALPDENQIAAELEFLINNPQEITAMGKRARAFIETEHDYIKIAGTYLEVWNKH